MNYDLDLVLEGDAVKFAEKFHFNKPISTVFHRRFGTVKLKFGNYIIDIASARREIYTKPGALPEVTAGTIEEDLLRRDFTINAMALNLSADNAGQLLDPYKGIEDLKLKLIRILHGNSFRDDASRMFRAIRYEQRLDFNIEPETLRLIKRDLNMIDTLSKDRIRNEVQLFFQEQYPEKCIRRANELGLLNKIYPALKYNEQMAECYKTARKHFKSAQLPVIYLCLLIYNLNSEQLEGFLNIYNFNKQQVSKMRQTISLKSEIGLLANPDLKNWQIFSMLRKYELQSIYINKIASSSHKCSKAIDLYLNKLRYFRPQLTGEDLINLGVRPGAEIGTILNSLHISWVNGEIKSREQEIELVREMLKSTGHNS
jgi:tRNA nucleotidyltransferase (CCA-adding enzyme)